MNKDKFNILEQFAQDIKVTKEQKGLLDYIPNPKQELFHRSIARIRFFIAGNRSGKTFAGAHEALWNSLGIHPYRQIKVPNKGWIVSLDFPQTRDVILPVIFDLLPDHEIKDYSKQDGLLYLKNGSIIGFKSCESGREKFQGADKDWIWFDEEPPEDIYKECIARIPGGGRSLSIWGTLTPLKGFSWVYHQIYMSNKPYIECFDASIFDNQEHLGEQEIKDFEDSLTEYEKEARLYGHFTVLAGSPVFSPEAIKWYMEQVQEPRDVGYLVKTKEKEKKKEEILFVKDRRAKDAKFKNGYLEIFDYPQKLDRYVIGADPSGGVYTNSIASILSLKRFKQVAKFRGKPQPTEFGEVLDFLGRYYNNALIVVERNNQGQSVIKTLQDLKYARLYRQKTFNRLFNKETINIGWIESKKTRPILINELEKVIREREMIIPSKETMNEFATFIITDANDMVAQTGCLDDEVFALGLAYQGYKTLPNYFSWVNSMKSEERQPVVRSPYTNY